MRGLEAMTLGKCLRAVEKNRCKRDSVGVGTIHEAGQSEAEKNEDPGLPHPNL